MFIQISDEHVISVDEIIGLVKEIPLMKGKRRRNRQWHNQKIIHVFPDEPIRCYLVTTDLVYGLSMSISGAGRWLLRAAQGIPVSLYTKH